MGNILITACNWGYYADTATHLHHHTRCINGIGNNFFPQGCEAAGKAEVEAA
jgi:hypothetical protein